MIHKKLQLAGKCSEAMYFFQELAKSKRELKGQWIQDLHFQDFQMYDTVVPHVLSK